MDAGSTEDAVGYMIEGEEEEESGVRWGERKRKGNISGLSGDVAFGIRWDVV